MIIINTTIKSKKYSISIVFLLIIALIGVFFAVKSESISSVQIFKDIDFASKDAKIDGYIMDIVESVDKPERFDLSDEDVSIVLDTLKKAEFKVIEKVSFTDVDYHINITLNKRYELQLDTKNQILIFKEDVDSANGELYFKVTNDNDFFKVIDELAKETLEII